MPVARDLAVNTRDPEAVPAVDPVVGQLAVDQEVPQVLTLGSRVEQIARAAVDLVVGQLAVDQGARAAALAQGVGQLAVDQGARAAALAQEVGQLAVVQGALARVQEARQVLAPKSPAERAAADLTVDRPDPGVAQEVEVTARANTRIRNKGRICKSVDEFNKKTNLTILEKKFVVLINADNKHF